MQGDAGKCREMQGDADGGGYKVEARDFQHEIAMNG